jgi:hypothetical protein
MNTNEEKIVESAQGGIDEPKDIFEVKYTAPRHARERILSTLRMRTTEPKSFAVAKVKTIYFDDRDASSFFDSVDGFIAKKKFRLREYIDSVGGARYSLEIKLRDDIKTSKLRKLIFKPLPDSYEFTTFRALLDTLERENGFSLARLRHSLPAEELYADTTIYYERFRFEDPFVDARYNLDTRIMLLPPERAEQSLRAGLYLNHDIFEIKSAAKMGLPSYLKGLGIEPVAFSKFVWGKELFL